MEINELIAALAVKTPFYGIPVVKAATSLKGAARSTSVYKGTGLRFFLYLCKLIYLNYKYGAIGLGPDVLVIHAFSMDNGLVRPC